MTGPTLVTFVANVHIMDLDPGDEVDWPETDEVKALESADLISRKVPAKPAKVDAAP